MADETIIRRNEQRKAISGQLYNLSAALFAAVAVKLYADLEMSRAVAIWFWCQPSYIGGAQCAGLA